MVAVHLYQLIRWNFWHLFIVLSSQTNKQKLHSQTLLLVFFSFSPSLFQAHFGALRDALVEEMSAVEAAEFRQLKAEQQAIEVRRLSRRSVPEEHRLDFSLEADFNRMGLGSYSKLRMVKQNRTMLCKTYPLELLFPAKLTDKELHSVAKFRSKQRLPVVTWFDVRTGATIARCSQPLVGMNSKRSGDDERLVRELALLTYKETLGMGMGMGMDGMGMMHQYDQANVMDGAAASGVGLGTGGGGGGDYGMDSGELGGMGGAIPGGGVEWESGESTAGPGRGGRGGSGQPGIRYYIIDARSKMAMQGNKLMGKGVEQVKYYRDGSYSAELHYMNIANIHAARESIDGLQVLCRPGALENAPSSSSGLWYGKVDSTGWLGHVHHIIKASNFIVEAVSQRCGVLVHCSDGWDRTPQLCCLAQMCLDPYYRTLKGFHVLIEKEWLAYGHKFSERCAHATQQPSEERSPVFTLWIDCVWQIMRQYPSIFEFNEVS